MDIQGILRKLPHRYPFLLVDRVLEIDKGKRIRALKNVTMNEPFFMGHFPARPSFDAVDADPGDDTVVYFAGIDGARFKRPVGPGDQLILEAEIDRAKAGIYRYKTRATVDGHLAVEAELMCTMRKVAPV
jgi:3-hydroxyacyl-[acyl-carrier-protein] dehydratase